MAVDVLLVEFGGVVPAFKEAVSGMSEVEYDEDEIMEMLITYLDDDKLAEHGLEAYTERIWEDHMIAGCPRDGEKMIEGALMLGNHLLDVLRRAGVYDKDGWLGGLHFDHWRGHQRTCAVFKRDPNEERCW